MFALAALWLLGAAAAPPGWRLSTEADARLPCPAHAALERSLRARRLGPWLDTSGADPDTVRLSHPDTWRLEVRRRDGSLALGRTLPGELACPEVAEASALILERWVAELARLPKAAPTAPDPMPRSGPDLPGTQAHAPPDTRHAEALDATADAGSTESTAISVDAGLADSPAALVDRARPIVPTDAHRADSPGLPTDAGSAPPLASAPPASAPSSPSLLPRGFQADLAGGPWLEDGRLSLAGALTLAVEWTPRLRAFAFSSAAAPVEREVSSHGAPLGTLRTQSWVAGAGVGSCLALPVELCGGPWGGVRWTLGSSQGPSLYQRAGRTAVAPTLGALLQATFLRLAGVGLGAQVAADFPLSHGGFDVEGTDASYRLPLFELWALVTLGFRLPAPFAND